MKSIATIRRASKWTAWAGRFGTRFNRCGGARSLALLLHVRANWTLVRIEARPVRAIVDFHPQYSWWVGTSQSIHRSRFLVNHVRLLSRMRMTSKSASVLFRSTGTAVERTRMATGVIRDVLHDRERELAMVVERRFAERASAQLERTTERLIHRSTRVEHQAASQSGIRLRREPAATVAAAIAAAQHPTSAPDIHDRRRTLPQPPAQPAMAAINVDQLADQVIRQIDRRVLARRERMGRT